MANAKGLESACLLDTSPEQRQSPGAKQCETDMSCAIDKIDIPTTNAQ